MTHLKTNYGLISPATVRPGSEIVKSWKDPSSEETPWIQRPWPDFQRQIAVNAVGLTLLLVCLLINEWKCSSLVRFIYRAKGIILALVLILRGVRHILAYKVQMRFWQIYGISKLFFAVTGEHLYHKSLKEKRDLMSARSLIQLSENLLSGSEEILLLLEESFSIILLHEVSLAKDESLESYIRKRT